MLDRDTRAAILKLAEQGHGRKTIAGLVGISKNTVRRVLESKSVDVLPLQREEPLEPHLERIRALHALCKGNVVRVCEKLADEGVETAYSTLTGFCRRHCIGAIPKQPAGRYHFVPGEEMQHDTSPHRVTLGGRERLLQCASLVLCYSRRQYAQLYPRWTRFEARVFLSEAIRHCGGAAARCMIDNSSVVIAEGTGKDAIPAPAMKALADRFGFAFEAHELGDANRSAHVERRFDSIERNFYPGRTFADLADLNTQLREWCERDFRRVRRRLGVSPAELFAVEQPALRPLPIHAPEIYDLHRRRVDVEAYVNLHTNRYSVDAELLHKGVEIRETIDRVRVFDGHRLVCEHDKEEHGAGKRKTLPQHEGHGRRRHALAAPSPAQRLLRGQGPEFAALVDALQKRHGGQAVKAVRRLHRIWTDYPTETVRGAISVALAYGLTDLERIETMVLRRVAGDIFRLPVNDRDDDQEEPDG